MDTITVASRVLIEDTEARMWKAMVNAECFNAVRMLRLMQREFYDVLVELGQLKVAETKSTPERLKDLSKCAETAKNQKLVSVEGKPYLVLVSIESHLVPVLMDRDDMCDYERFTSRIQERVPLYDKVLDYGWQHWETCRNQKNFFKVNI